MKILAIETATELCSVAVSIDGRLYKRSEHSPRGHADLLLPWVEELLAESATRLQEFDALAFSRGPGSFTSLRIGIGVAQGLAWGAGIPVVPVSSLRTTAQAAVAAGVESAIVALDARMGEVYCGIFRRDGQGVMQPAGDEMVCPPEAVMRLDSDGWAGIGNGFERYPELAEFGRSLISVHADTWPGAEAMIPLALNWLKTNDPLSADQAQPVYLRDQVAVKPGKTGS